MIPKVLVYNVESLGPMVTTDTILHVLCGLRNRWAGGAALIKSIATIVEIEAEARASAPLVRLAPMTPAGVEPFVTEIEYTRD